MQKYLQQVSSLVSLVLLSPINWGASCLLISECEIIANYEKKDVAVLYQFEAKQYSFLFAFLLDYVVEVIGALKQLVSLPGCLLFNFTFRVSSFVSVDNKLTCYY